MKVLVSGGTGFVGRYVVEGLIDAGHEVIVAGRHSPISPLMAGQSDMELGRAAQPISPLEGEMSGRTEGGNAGENAAISFSVEPLPTPLCHLSVTSPPQGGRSKEVCLTLDPTLDQSETFVDIDAFIHLAFDHLPGRYRGGEGDDPKRFRKLNLDGSVKLFDDAKAAGVKRCIFLSSRAVYDGLPAGSALREDMVLSPDSLYGQIKWQAEQELTARASSSFITTSLRATGVYGHNSPNKWDGLFADYIAEKPVATRAGSEVHGADLTAAILLLLKHSAEAVDGKSFNISDIVTDSHEILSLFAEAIGLSHPLPAPADHTSVNVMDTARLRALGWQPGGREKLKSTLRLLARTVRP